MRKQRVFLLVFVVLALAISVGVYFGAKADARRRRMFDLRERARQADPFQTVPRPGQSPLPPARPLPPAGTSTENVQRTLKTIEDVQRINRLNREMRQRQEEPPQGAAEPSAPQKP